MAKKKSETKADPATPKQPKPKQSKPKPPTLKEHCEEVRKTLVALYEQSKHATHPVIQGSLREGFVRQVLGGFLGRSVSWSSGQVVGPAPNNERSGQMDLLLHDDLLPQIYLYDGVLCLVPHDALFGAIEVKSDLTTGNTQSVLHQAMDSLVNAMKVCGVADPRPAFVIAAFQSGVRSSNVVQKVSDYLTDKDLPLEQFWPDAIVVLSATKQEPKGFGIFRDCFGGDSRNLTPVDGLREGLWMPNNGGDALGGLVALLARRRIQRSVKAEQFDFAKYIFSPASQEAMPTPPVSGGASSEGATVPTERA